MAGTYSWDVIHRAAVMASATAVSTKINVPRNCAAMTIIPPPAAAGQNWKLQSLSKVSDGDSEVWNDSYVLEPSSGLIQLTFPLQPGAAITLPYNIFGGGILRISTYSDVQAADVVWSVMFSGFKN